ncbi:MAG: MBL fold metallo-hydrolase [Rhodobacteraceae bacterium]|nr:MBL fold metallo-hydrolase [Paracoccaceae bacterium]
MFLTRRQLLQTSAAATLGGLAPMRSWSSTELTDGNITVQTLSDGKLTLPASFLLDGLPMDEVQPILDKYGFTGDQYTPDCNITLVRDGTNTILFDVGSGPDFMSSAGKLGEAMDAIGLDPMDVTHVVFTHAHPDHLWGLLDDFGDPLFAEATYMIGRAEWDYWMNPETVNTIGTSRQVFAVGALNRLQTIEDNVVLFDDGEEIIPGVAARGTFGHTPGHMSFDVAMSEGGLMIVGDAIANYHIAFERPDILSNSDQDPEMGAAARTSLLDQIASEKKRLIGFHLPYPGIGRAERKDGGFVFVPET